MESLKRFILKVVFDVWEADNFMIVKLLEVEKAQDKIWTPKYVVSFDIGTWNSGVACVTLCLMFR